MFLLVGLPVELDVERKRTVSTPGFHHTSNVASLHLNYTNKVNLIPDAFKNLAKLKIIVVSLCLGERTLK